MTFPAWSTELDEDFYFSQPLEINSSVGFYRIIVEVKSELKRPLPKYFIHMLDQYLLLSGLFDTDTSKSLPALQLVFRDSLFTDTVLSFETIEGVALYNSMLDIDPDPLVNRAKIVRYLDQAIQTIDGKISIFSSALLYVEKDQQGFSSIYLVDYLGKNRHRLVSTKHRLFFPVWSPNANNFLFTWLNNNGASVWLYDFDKRKARRISPFGVYTTGGTWTDNGQAIIFTQAIDEQINLVWHELASGSTKPIFSGPYITTGGNLHENKLLYTSDKSWGVQIYRKNDYQTPGKDFRMTFSGGNNSEPKWSNNGSMFLFSSFRNNSFQIYLMSEDGKRFKQLTRDKGYSEQGVFSPDNRQVLYVNQTDFGQRLMFISLDSKYRRKMFHQESPRDETNPAWTDKFDWAKWEIPHILTHE